MASVVLPVPTSPVSTTYPSPSRIPYRNVSRASLCFSPSHRNLGSVLTLNGFSCKLKCERYIGLHQVEASRGGEVISHKRRDPAQETQACPLLREHLLYRFQDRIDIPRPVRRRTLSRLKILFHASVLFPPLHRSVELNGFPFRVAVCSQP